MGHPITYCESNIVNKSYLILILAVLASLLLSSCQNDTPKAKPLALATIHPYELLLSELLEPQIEVKSIMPINSSPHTWSPNPSDLVLMEQADFILSNGFGLENPIRPQLRRHSTKRFQISEIKGIATLDHHHEGEAEHDDEVVDPHVWTAPRQIIKILDKLVPRLSQVYPDLADTIASRAKNLNLRLQELDSQIKTERAQFNEPGLITYHNSFAYFLRDYDIKLLGTIQSSPGQEPSAREMSDLGTTIRSNNVKAIFVEPQMSRHSADVVANEFGLQVLTLDPLGTQAGATDIVQFIRLNWQIMKLAFND